MPRGRKKVKEAPVELTKKRGRPKKAVPASVPSFDPEIKTGIFEITETRPWKIVKGPISRYTSKSQANEALRRTRDQELAAGRNPFRYVLLPLGTKGEGLLP